MKDHNHLSQSRYAYFAQLVALNRCQIANPLIDTD
jgi:hypothetical protein